MTAVATSIFASPPAAAASAVDPIETVLARLEASRRRGGGHPVGSSILAVCTLGLLPLWTWPTRWQLAVQEDQRDLSALAAWWGRRAPGAVAQRLNRAARRLGGGATLSSLALTGAFVAFSALLTWLFLRGVPAVRVAGIIYRPPHELFRSAVGIHAWQMHNLWMGVLIVAYALHYLGVRSHTAAMKRFVSASESAAGAAGLRWPASRYCLGGLNPMWIGCGIVMSACGLWWGIPLALAGARQRRYLRSVRPAIRLELAKQARAAMGASGMQRLRCATVGCGAPLPPEAGFCPRCGARA